MAAAGAIIWAAFAVPEIAFAQDTAPTAAPAQAAQPSGTEAESTFDADMKGLPQPPSDASLPQVEPVIPDSEFKDLVPEFTPGEEKELNRPLETIQQFEQRLESQKQGNTAPGKGNARQAKGQQGNGELASTPLSDQTTNEPVSDVPLGDKQLLAPLPPLDSFRVEPVEITGAQSARPTEVRYDYRINGLEKADAKSDADLRGLFDGVSSLRDGGGKASNISQVYARMDHDAKLLGTILSSEGWYSARVDAHIGASADDKPDKLTAVIDVDPGQRYTFGTIAIKAQPTVPPGLIEDNLQLKPGAPIVAQRVEAGEARVTLVLPQKGYPFAKVGDRDILLHRDMGKGDYTLPVDIGPRSKFGDITTSGDETFGAKHIAVIARFKKGELYDGRKIDDLNKALVATGLFATVAAKPMRTGEDAGDGTEYANIHVEQHAGPPRTIAASAGYGTGEGFKAQASWTHHNLFPPEGALTVAGTAGTQEQSLGVTFKRANAGRRDRTFQLSAKLAHTDYAAVNGYTARLATRWSYDSTPIWRKTLSYAYGGQALVTAEEDYDFSLGDVTRRTFYIAGLEGDATLDLTDSLLDPTKGFRLKAQVEPEASIHTGFHPYVRTRLDASAYYPISDSLVLAGRVSAGSIQGIARSDLAPSRRFYAGGGGSVRGYGYQELGPRVLVPNPNYDPAQPDKTSPYIERPLGGRSFNEASAEIRYRFGTWGVVGFVDTGQAYEASLPKFSDLQFGAGIGARYYTNFGPIRVDLATPLNPRPGDGWLSVYVSIGQAF